MTTAAPMKVGIFGGTFDPVHLGHLILAEQCREQARLDEVWFVPAARPPHKLADPLTPFAQRVEMLALAAAGHRAFRINQIEKDRPGPSYTIETLRSLQQAGPELHYCLLLGSDCLPDLPSWREPQRIVELAELLIVARPGYPAWAPERLAAELNLPVDVRLRMQLVPSPLIDIAARDLRRRAADGKSLRYLVPRGVECYIETHGLYR